MWSRFVLLFLVLASVTRLAEGIQTAACDNTRMAVLECIHTLLDLDHDERITPVEVAVALETTFTFVPTYLTWQLVMQCDLDEDGVLTMDDWAFSPPNATCLPTQNCLNIACNVCVQNGFVQTKRAPPPPPPPVPPQALQDQIRRQVKPGAAETARQRVKRIEEENAKKAKAKETKPQA